MTRPSLKWNLKKSKRKVSDLNSFFLSNGHELAEFDFLFLSSEEVVLYGRKEKNLNDIPKMVVGSWTLSCFLLDVGVSYLQITGLLPLGILMDVCSGLTSVALNSVYQRYCPVKIVTCSEPMTIEYFFTKIVRNFLVNVELCQSSKRINRVGGNTLQCQYVRQLYK